MSSSTLPIARPSGNYYGIQLADSEYRTWELADENTSRLIYHWDKMDTNIYSSLQDTIVSVTKKHPNYSASTIKNIAKTIRQTNRLRINDNIFGIDNQIIEKIGYIDNMQITNNQQITVTVNWVSDESLGETTKSIFHVDDELQLLNIHELRLIERQFANKLQFIYARLPSADQAYETLKLREYESFESIPEDNYMDTPKEDKGGIINVFYGTNRNKIGEENGIPEYGDQEADEISYGVCDIQLPEGHRQGELERPGKFLWLFPLPENQHAHIVLKSITEMDETTFLANLAKRLVDKPKRHALLFVHGYNTSFKDAAYRTAQLAWDIPFVGYSGFYSWPSAARLLPYPSDGASARSSVLYLKTYIKQILKVPELEELHIIAHSMGGLALTLSLKDLKMDPAMGKYLEKVSQLILGAPDIDQKEFRNEIFPHFNSVGKRRTMYASDHDMALEWSSTARSFRERLGQVGDEIFVAEGLDSVEASNLKTSSSHAYLFESKILLSDLYFLITHGLAPQDRRLREIAKSPVNYWLFPK